MSDKPVVVAIHGVGDSDPGAIVRSLAAHFGPAVYERRELLIGEASYPAAIAAGKRVVAEVPGGAEPERLPDLFEVNWADVRKPKNNITGVVRHLFRLMLAMLYLGERWHYGRESPSRAAALYRWAVEGLLVWGTVYALVTRLMHAAGGGLAVVYGPVGAVAAVLVGLWFRSSSRAFFVSSCIAAAALLLNTAWLAWPGASTSDAV